MQQRLVPIESIVVISCAWDGAHSEILLFKILCVETVKNPANFAQSFLKEPGPSGHGGTLVQNLVAVEFRYIHQ